MTVTGYDFLVIGMLVVLEGLLSADNAMVLAVLALGLPREDRRHALWYGMAGAFLFRGAALLFGLYLIRLSLVKLAGALYLLYLAWRHFLGEKPPGGGRAVRPAAPWLGLSAFWATVVKVELTDIVFAVDSIVVAVGMSQKAWVVLSGGILGIVAMRLVIGQLLPLIERYPVLVDGAFVIIAWVGARLLVQYLHQAGVVAWEVPEWLGYGLIVVIFGVSLFWGWRGERRAHTGNEDPQP
jgi:YkoY family integral membrane protein